MNPLPNGRGFICLRWHQSRIHFLSEDTAFVGSCLRLSEVCDRIDLVEKVSTERGFKVKFYIRRAVVGVVAVPAVAGGYVFGYLGLMLLGAENGLKIEEIWNNGMLIGGVSAVMLVFAPQVNKFLNKVTGE